MFRPLIACCCLSLPFAAAASAPPSTEAASAEAQSAQMAPASAEGVILLRNGGVLQGEVRRTGDVYQIEMPHGLIEVPAFRVANFFPSMVEAYLYQQAARGPASVKNCLVLAHWCLQNDLSEQAATELETARAINPQHPGVLQFERELRVAELSAQKRDKTPTVPKMYSLAHKHSSRTLQKPQLQKSQSQKPQSQHVPQESRVEFLRSIQPMLISNCTTTGCHTDQSQQEFQLNRFATRGGGNPQLVALNLDAVLAQTAGDSLEQSPLLRLAQQEHGGRNAAQIARFGSTQLSRDQFEILRTWCYHSMQVPLPEELEAKATAQGGSEAEYEELAEATAEYANELPSEYKARTTPAHVTLPGQRFQQQEPTDGGIRDEFDPAIFNRRMAKRQASGRDRN